MRARDPIGAEDSRGGEGGGAYLNVLDCSAAAARLEDLPLRPFIFGRRNSNILTEVSIKYRYLIRTEDAAFTGLLSV
jgi:hypothetical protein